MKSFRHKLRSCNFADLPMAGHVRARPDNLGKSTGYSWQGGALPLSYTRIFWGNNNVQRPAWRNLLIASAELKLLNPNWALSASYEQSTSMKKLILLCICSTALAASLFAQVPTASPIASPPAATPAATIAAIASPSDLADRIHQKLEKKFGGKHGKHGIIIGGDHDELDLDDGKSHEDIPAMVIPLVGIVFLTIFGAPVLIVIAIGIFALL